MRYIMTFIMCAALLQMVGYVGSAILGAEYSASTVFVVSIIVTALIFIMSTVIPQPEPQEHTQH